MAQVFAGMVMSLDGYVADAKGDLSRLYPDFAAMQQDESLQAALQSTGAVVMGRRSYEMGNGDFTGYEFQVPIFVVTHDPPAQAAKGENEQLTFTFVTAGIERAIARAKAAAGDRDVRVIGGASTIQQCLRAGLVDELEIDLRPVLLGGGLRLFDDLAGRPIDLETVEVSESPLVAHLRFRVLKDE